MKSDPIHPSPLKGIQMPENLVRNLVDSKVEGLISRSYGSIVLGSKDTSASKLGYIFQFIEINQDALLYDLKVNPPKLLETLLFLDQDEKLTLQYAFEGSIILEEW